jgi:hypothetical protein
MEKGRGRGRGEWDAKTGTSSMMKTRGAAPHVATAAFSASLEQYALRLLAALRPLRRWRERDAASRLLLQRVQPPPPPPPAASVKESNRAVVYIVVPWGAWPRAAHVEHRGCLLLLALVVNPRTRTRPCPPRQRRRRLAALPLAPHCCATLQIIQGALARCSAAGGGGGGGGDARRKHSAFTVGGAGRRHSGAPILRRYAAASALFCSMAYLSAVLPVLQRRE